MRRRRTQNKITPPVPNDRTGLIVCLQSIYDYIVCAYFSDKKTRVETAKTKHSIQVCALKKIKCENAYEYQTLSVSPCETDMALVRLLCGTIYNTEAGGIRIHITPADHQIYHPGQNERYLHISLGCGNHDVVVDSLTPSQIICYPLY